MFTSTAVVSTDAAARYAKQLLAHLGRKAGVEPVDGDPDAGRLTLSAGTGIVRPRADHLLLEARAERALGRLRTGLARLELLVLDELGYVPTSQAGAELLFDVISTAYEKTSVIVTTNLPFEEWKEVLGSERLTGATLDRLTHRCTIVETGRESYRLRDARQRRREPVIDDPQASIDAERAKQ